MLYCDKNKTYAKTLMTKIHERDDYIRELAGIKGCSINAEIIYKAIEKLYIQQRIKFIIKPVLNKYTPSVEIVDKTIPELIQSAIIRYFEELCLERIYPTHGEILNQLKLTIEEEESVGLSNKFPKISLTQYNIKPTKEDAVRYREDNKDILKDLNLPDNLSFEILNIIVKFLNMSVDLSEIISKKSYSELELEYIGYCLYLGSDIKTAENSLSGLIPMRCTFMRMQMEKSRDSSDNKQEQLKNFIKEMHEPFFI